MKPWMWWGGAAAALYWLFRKTPAQAQTKSPTRVVWVSSTGAQTRDFERQDIARTFADALISAGARDVKLSAIV